MKDEVLNASDLLNERDEKTKNVNEIYIDIFFSLLLLLSLSLFELVNFIL